MSKIKTLGTAQDAVAILFDGKIVKRSTAYDVVRRLPDHLKVRVGRTLYVNLPRLQSWINGEREAA